MFSLPAYTLQKPTAVLQIYIAQWAGTIGAGKSLQMYQRQWLNKTSRGASVIGIFFTGAIQSWNAQNHSRQSQVFFTKKKREDEPEHASDAASSELDEKHQELETEKEQKCAAETESKKQIDTDQGPSTSEVLHHER